MPMPNSAVAAGASGRMTAFTRPLLFWPEPGAGRSRRYVRSSSPSALAGHARRPPTGISLTIAEPANQAVRPAYAKLERGLLG
jgi:hypothetical protein